MSTPRTDRETEAERLLRRLAGRRPDEPVGRRPVGKAIWALWAVFVPLFAFSTFASWGEKSLLASYQAACFLLGFGVLPVLVHLAYRRRRSPTLGDLLALTGLLAVTVGVVLLVADAWLSGQMKRFWSVTIVFAVLAVLYAAVVVWQPRTSPKGPRPGR